MVLAVASAPLLSVCMPTYNGAAHVREALDSLLAQDYPNMEVLVFDDASTDGCWEFLESIRDERLRLYRNSVNLGPQENWNRALSAARGTYLKLFHQDDRLGPGCLSRQVAALEAHPEAVFSCCARHILRPDGRRLMERSAGWPTGLVTARDVINRCALQGANVVGEPTAVMMRRSVVEQVGGFDASIPYLVDLDYWVRMLEHGPAYFDSSVLVGFRVSPRQWSAAIGLRQGREFGAFLERLGGGPLQGRWGLIAWGRARAHLNGLLRTLLYRFI